MTKLTMKTHVKMSHRLEAISACSLLTLFCSSTLLGSCSEETIAHRKPFPLRHSHQISQCIKAEAPVSLLMQRYEDGPSKTKIVLGFVPLRTIPRAVLRFSLPPEQRVIAGTTVVDFGTVESGQFYNASISVSTPSHGGFLVAAGIDAHLSPGVKLHKGASMTLGTLPAEPQGQVVHFKDSPYAVRMYPAQKKIRN